MARVPKASETAPPAGAGARTDEASATRPRQPRENASSMAEDYGASGLSGLCSDESGIRPFSREDVSRAIDGLSERIRALENSDNERMDYESTRFEQFDRRIDGHSRQFADVDTKLTGIRGELATIAERFETVKAQIERILERFKFLARTFGGD